MNASQHLGRIESQNAAAVHDCEVSIIIPALNEAKVIGRCLESIVQMEFPRPRFEVIVVDNGSTDGTVSIAESFGDRMNLKVLSKTGIRISALRNLGAREATGAVLAFLDADCLVPQNWLSDIVELLPRDGAGIVGAHYLLPADSSWVGRVWHQYQEAPKSGDVSHVPAGDLVMRRKDYFDLGGFDERIQTNEDYELCERARGSGLAVRAYPRIGVVHLGTAQSLRIFYRKQRWHGTHVMKVFLRNVVHSHNRKAVFFAAFTLLSALWILVTAFWALFGGTWILPALGVLALFAPPLALSVRRIASGGKWRDFFPLTTMYLVYGIARARALLNVASIF